MKLNPNTPLADITIQGLQFKVPQPFSQGHVLTENEAGALNQVFAENIRNNKAGVIEKAQEAAKKEGAAPVNMQTLQGEIDKYVSEYEFGAKKFGVRVVDPVEREARSLAKSKIEAQLKKQGKKLADVSAESMNAMISGALDKYPKIRQDAAKIVKARESAGGTLDLEGLETGTAGA